MEKPTINLNITSTGLYIALFYLATKYEDVLARNIFWWIQVIGIVAGVIVLVALSGMDRPLKAIHPITSVTSAITSIVVAWMIWTLGFIWVFWAYVIVSTIVFIGTIPYVRAE